MDEWELVKQRTAAEGAVWRSPDHRLYKRTGDSRLLAEAEHQRHLFDLGFPVPQPLQIGTEQGECFFIESSAGPSTLHDRAVRQAEHNGGIVDDLLIDQAAAISQELLHAQSAHPLDTTPQRLRAWFAQASFLDNVFEENPDLDTQRVRALIDMSLERLSQLPMCHGHQDYGTPNAFDDLVIDWQHHAPAPLGYDVYPMLDVAAFKGGAKGYAFTPEQRAHYVSELDTSAEAVAGLRISSFHGDFLLTKCFFFLALMKPRQDQWRHHDKQMKWRYRRELFKIGFDQYARTRNIDTYSFPDFNDFVRRN
jgi:hypothetical protein